MLQNFMAQQNENPKSQIFDSIKIRYLRMNLYSSVEDRQFVKFGDIYPRFNPKNHSK